MMFESSSQNQHLHSHLQFEKFLSAKIQIFQCNLGILGAKIQIFQELAVSFSRAHTCKGE